MLILFFKRNIIWEVMPHVSGEEDPLSPRFRAFAVTLSSFAVGEYLPLLPACGGRLSPPCLTTVGTPPLPAISLGDKGSSETHPLQD